MIGRYTHNAVASSHCLLYFLLSTIIASVQPITLPSSYDVVWNTQSQNSAGSMPVGGGDIGLNVWAEKKQDDILFYIAKSGTFDENNSMLKLGRVRLRLNPNPFANGPFEQRLLLNDGYVRFTGSDNTTVNIWVDVFNPMIRIEIQSPKNIALETSYENWRYKDYQMRDGEQAQSSWGVSSSPMLPNITAYADRTRYFENGVLMDHSNDKLPLWDFQVHQQNLDKYKDQMYTPMLNNRFGLWMFSPQCHPGPQGSGSYVNTTFHSWSLKSYKPGKTFNVNIALYQKQEKDYNVWQQGLQAVARNNNSHSRTLAWWHDFWARSYIVINENAGADDAGFQVGKNYQLFRYMMGCNAYGEWPSKFNGGMFTFDPVFVTSGYTFTPDYRRWGGGTFTAQNQRLLYWPLLRSGDFDVMKGQFDFYKRITPNAKLRGKVFAQVNATYFNEQIDNSGLPNVFEYDGDLYRYNETRPIQFPPGETWNAYLVYLQDTANEFADMILQANIYSGMDIHPYLDFIESQLAWFDQYYQQQLLGRDVYPLTGISGNQYLVIYPASGAETYKDAYNPASTISGLRKVLSDLIQVGQFSLQPKSYYQSYLSRVPETSFRLQNNLQCISPATSYTRIQNTEPIQMYPVFPWSEFGLGLPNLTIALNTYYNDTETHSFFGNTGWKQDVIWLARMGVTESASNLTESRFSDSTTFRFPAFKGPNYDWAPDMNHYGSASIALQEQLCQTFVGNEIRLLGAWPTRWDARFKVWAPGNTTVEGTVAGGQIGDLKVSPSSRQADVVIGRD